MTTRCFCGRPLHYRQEGVQRFIEKMVEEHGETIPVTVGARTWHVQRHYLALHGLKAADLPRLGFEEVTASTTTHNGKEEHDD